MELSGWNRATSPYHPGEQDIHAKLGRKEHQERMGRQIHRPFMPDQHRDFFSQLPFLLAGTVDTKGWPWASILFGNPGFIESPTETSMVINTTPIPGDPMQSNLRTGSAIGLVGIELSTRRRNRMNGVIHHADDTAIQIDVVQSYGNCPQYIQTRGMEFIRDPMERVTPERDQFREFDKSAIDLIQRSDTFFVASYNNQDNKLDNGGADVNHRGGRPGFVKVEGNTLTIPDYIGNFAFNTLGNFQVNPKAGLLFVDFDSGDLLQLTGTVEILWDTSDEISAFRGAERAWRFTLDHGLRLKQATPMRWQYREESPNSSLTGNWDEAARTLLAQQQRDAWRPLRVTRVEDESAVIRSFYLEAADDSGLLNYQPGQFLTIKITPENGKPQVRTYTLSSAPDDGQYRISVKRESTTDSPDGVVSNFLHNTVGVGDIIDAKSPRGDFWMDTTESRPAALFAAGVGITPMISMARQAISDSVRRRHLRPIAVLHAARSTADRAFADEFVDLQKASNGLLRYVSIVGKPLPEEKLGQDFHASGQLSHAITQAVLPLADYDCYLCGPTLFMQNVYDMLIDLGVSDERIFAESFGPASLNRITSNGAGDVAANFEPVDEAVVHFDTAQFEQAWTPNDGTLLEFAEAHGLTPDFGCRSGACGSCAVRVLSGKTGYATTPKIHPADDKILICCAVPAKSDEQVRLEL